MKVRVRSPRGSRPGYRALCVPRPLPGPGSMRQCRAHAPHAGGVPGRGHARLALRQRPRVQARPGVSAARRSGQCLSEACQSISLVSWYGGFAGRSDRPYLSCLAMHWAQVPSSSMTGRLVRNPKVLRNAFRLLSMPGSSTSATSPQSSQIRNWLACGCSG